MEYPRPLVSRSTSAHLVLARFGVAVAVALAAACSFGTAESSAAPNTCTITGISHAVASKIFGAGTVVRYMDFGNGATPCEVTPLHDPGTGGTYVDLFPKDQFKNQVTAAEGQGIAVSKLKGLGAGAVLIKGKDYTPYHLFFVAGAYTVELDSVTEGGGAASIYPTAEQWETLAHAIHTRIH